MRIIRIFTEGSYCDVEIRVPVDTNESTIRGLRLASIAISNGLPPDLSSVGKERNSDANSTNLDPWDYESYARLMGYLGVERPAS